MNAIVWTAYGPPDGLHLREVDRPTPHRDELRIRIRATTVAAGDCELRALRFPFGMRLLIRLLMGIGHPRDKILGQEFAGEVESVGPDVHQFRVGDAVFGTTGFGFGAYAEYLCLPEAARDRALTRKPTNMTFEEAATVPTGGLEAWHFLRAAGDLRGKSVLINGAGGGIGTWAVQLAKHDGARVTAVDRREKLGRLRALGADRVVDFAQEDFTQLGERYDVIFDIPGRSRFSACLAALTEHGCYLLGNPDLSARLRASLRSRNRGKRIVARSSRQSTEDLVALRDLIEHGSLRAVVDRTYSLEQIPEAHRFVDTGAMLGKVAVTVSGPPSERVPSGGAPRTPWHGNASRSGVAPDLPALVAHRGGKAGAVLGSDERSGYSESRTRASASTFAR